MDLIVWCISNSFYFPVIARVCEDAAVLASHAIWLRIITVVAIIFRLLLENQCTVSLCNAITSACGNVTRNTTKNTFKKFREIVVFEHLQHLCEQKNIKVLSTILESRSAKMKSSIVLRSTSLPKSAHLLVTLRAAQSTLLVCALASF